jgi:hypothetical protein
LTALSALSDGVYRDLADEGKKVFTDPQIKDFIRGGIADLNRVAPVEAVHDLEFQTDPDTGVITYYSYLTPITLPYRVEVVRMADGYTVPWDGADPGNTDSSGWTFRKSGNGGVITFAPWFISRQDPLVYGVRLHGYASRPLPALTGDPELPLSENEEFSVRAYARQQGFDLLAHDRALFAQWQGQTNNTDVSPTQMMQMAANAKQEWDRHRGLIRVVRRYE